MTKLTRIAHLGLIAAAFGLAGTALAAEGAAKTAKPAKGAKAGATGTETPAADAKAPAKDAPKADDGKAGGTVVELKTSEGTIKIALDDKAAPVTVKNFLTYVNEKFYDGTIFHRVIDGFMIQGGGYTVEGGKLKEKATKSPIINEAKNGLKNARGSIAMARTSDPNSATAQFFINLVDNNNLDHPSFDGHGYAVFGKVIEGLEVVDKIGKTATGMRDGMGDVPKADVKIVSASVGKAGVN